MKRFRAIEGTKDMRITKGRIYEGEFVYLDKPFARGEAGWRIRVIDNSKAFMTFNPKIFIPSEGAAND